MLAEPHFVESQLVCQRDLLQRLTQRLLGGQAFVPGNNGK